MKQTNDMVAFLMRGKLYIFTYLGFCKFESSKLFMNTT